MPELQQLSEHINARLDDVHNLSPADELARYEQVLADLTELLNAPEDHGPGSF
ncbi:MAG TPA: hypothetical protein VIG71_07900 [Enteractinococcus sp.]